MAQAWSPSAASQRRRPSCLPPPPLLARPAHSHGLSHASQHQEQRSGSVPGARTAQPSRLGHQPPGSLPPGLQQACSGSRPVPAPREPPLRPGEATGAPARQPRLHPLASGRAAQPPPAGGTAHPPGQAGAPAGGSRRAMAPGAASEAAAALARLARLLAALLLLACAAGPPGGAAQQLTDGQLAVVEQQCPVSVRYAITLGEPEGNGTSAQVPIFVATMTLENNANVSRLGSSSCQGGAGGCRDGGSGSGRAGAPLPSFLSRPHSFFPAVRPATGLVHASAAAACPQLCSIQGLPQLLPLRLGAHPTAACTRPSCRPRLTAALAHPSPNCCSTPLRSGASAGASLTSQ